ncbi:MAG: deoxyribodipyrimidine photo-lyase [Alphaproteobacteria bacterium]
MDDKSPGPWALGGASRWWLHHSLSALSASLSDRGSRLILRRGPVIETVVQFARDVGADALHLSRRYEPFAACAERNLRSALASEGVACHRHAATLLVEPESVRTGAGAPYKVFTPFHKAILGLGDPVPPLPAPTRLPAPSSWPESDALDDWRLAPTAPDWSGGLADAWSPGEEGANRRLDAFLEDALADYSGARDRPGRVGTSRLSPHLRFGEISPRTVWHRIRFAARDVGHEAMAEAFLREIVWREFSYHLLHHFPHIADAPFRPEFEAFPWADDDAALTRWQRGITGYPVVDAGMRELWATGWMHNRVRMIVASFLVKDLMIPWQRGAAWFWDTLVDADLANNSANWQWVAGSGADAAPYFRIFNPVLQGRKFDAEGTYVRRWVPEIASLPDRFVHAPWETPDDIMRKAGVRLGETYPAPMVDHGDARHRALAAFRSLPDRS